VNSPEKIPFKLELNWKISLFALAFLPILLGLGFWQLQRADEKSTIQQSLEQQQALPPLDLTRLTSAENMAFRRVVFTGRPDPEHIWLIENQVYQGRLGFHFLIPVALEDGRHVLVNAGWLSAPASRQENPIIPPLPETTVFTGQLRTIRENPFLRAQHTGEGWPKRLLQVDLAAMEKSLGKPLLPWVVQLDETSPVAQTVYWPVVNMSADKHIAYAVQWFLMAFALVILWLYANSNLGRRSVKNKNEKVTSGE
jgi:surfeit locus 1 family protein